MDLYQTIANSPLLWIAIALVVVLFVLQNVRPPNAGWSALRFSERRGLNVLGWFSALLTPVWAILLGLVLYSIARLTLDFTPELEADDLRWHVLSLVGMIGAFGALVGAPVALIRVFTTERQTTTAEQGLITDRINKAVEGIGAEKLVKRQRKKISPGSCYSRIRPTDNLT